VIGVLVLGGSGLGCGAPSHSDPDPGGTGIATVDSLVAPQRIAPTDTLSVRLIGRVGPNGCYSLSAIEASRTEGDVRLVPRVRHERGGMCTMAIVPLDATYRVAPPFEPGAFAIEVPQAGRAAVTDTVMVEGT
jgi:hypothetical protein